MSETLIKTPEEQQDTLRETAQSAGRVTVLELLAEESEGISINASHRSTQMGNGVDAEDD